MKNLKQKFHHFEKAWRESFSAGLETTSLRKSAHKHAYWVDHEILRQFYHNDHEIYKNVFRSNQPSPRRIKKWNERGIRTIINFRGESNQGAYLLEKEACEKYNVELINFRLFATKLVESEVILELEKIFKAVKSPFLMHCKSGSDRVGLGSALYLIYILRAPIEIAQRQLSIKFLHLGGWTAGILDYMLMEYRLAYASSKIGFKDWVVNEYDPKELTSGFEAFRKNNHFLKIPR